MSELVKIQNIKDPTIIKEVTSNVANQPDLLKNMGYRIADGETFTPTSSAELNEQVKKKVEAAAVDKPEATAEAVSNEINEPAASEDESKRGEVIALHAEGKERSEITKATGLHWKKVQAILDSLTK